MHGETGSGCVSSFHVALNSKLLVSEVVLVCLWLLTDTERKDTACSVP